MPPSVRRMWPFVALQQRPWPPSPAVPKKLDSSRPIEEETTPYYLPDRFYPTRLGEVLNDRYQVATKLGFGSNSTVWLARDLHRFRWSKERYLAIKIHATSHLSLPRSPEAELPVLARIGSANPSHTGWNFVRKLVDHFELLGPSGKHICLVFEPLREPLWLYCRRYVGGVIPSDVLKVIVRMILLGMDYLHSECEIIHTDLKPDNVMIRLEEPSVLERDVRDEYEHPLPQKHVDDRIIYLSRNNYGKLLRPTGVIQITDFDLAVFGDTPHSGCIQSESYRAPEVIIDAGYSYAADIWSLGVMLWDLLEGRKLFGPVVHPRPHGEYSDRTHLAYITRLLGPPPSDLIAAGRRTPLFYQPDGNLKDPSLVPEEFSFEGTIEKLDGEDKTLFIDFAKQMIKWQPDERKTAKELLEHPWLHD